MAFHITITEEATQQLEALSARDQGIIRSAVNVRLLQQPTTATRAIQRLRPNLVAQFELRLGDLRVLYNVEGDEVVLLLVGRKVGNKLLVAGEEFHEHQDHPPEPPGSGPSEDVE